MIHDEFWVLVGNGPYGYMGYLIGVVFLKVHFGLLVFVNWRLG
jgi:hypothetical protein